MSWELTEFFDQPTPGKHEKARGEGKVDGKPSGRTPVGHMPFAHHVGHNDDTQPTHLESLHGALSANTARKVLIYRKTTAPWRFYVCSKSPIQG